MKRKMYVRPCLCCYSMISHQILTQSFDWDDPELDDDGGFEQDGNSDQSYRFLEMDVAGDKTFTNKERGNQVNGSDLKSINLWE